MRGAVIAGCTKQFQGMDSAPGEALRQWTTTAGSTPRAAYNPERSRTFHHWVSLCQFTPQRPGRLLRAGAHERRPRGHPRAERERDQPHVRPRRLHRQPRRRRPDRQPAHRCRAELVRLRAVPASATMRSHIAVAGYSRMPLLQNAALSTATFNLIRALPGTKGQYVSFDFYDAADGSTSSGGQVKVLAPADATGSIKALTGVPGCKGALGSASFAPLTACTVAVRSSTHNGKLQRMVIPLPNDYDCDPEHVGRLLVPRPDQLHRVHRHRLHHLGRQHRRRPGAADRVAPTPGRPRRDRPDPRGRKNERLSRPAADGCTARMTAPVRRRQEHPHPAPPSTAPRRRSRCRSGGSRCWRSS